MADQLMREMVSMFEAELKAQGWRQSEFCRAFRASPHHLNACLRGHTQPSLSLIEYWANCLGKTFKVTLEFKDE